MPHRPFFPVPGLGPLPFHFAQSFLTTERLSGSGLHRPLSRTRSEPLPPSATAPPPLGPLQPRLERLKPHIQLTKHQQVFLWDHQRLAGRLPRGSTGDSVLLPLAQGSHRPLSRAQSSPCTLR